MIRGIAATFILVAVAGCIAPEEGNRNLDLDVSVQGEKFEVYIPVPNHHSASAWLEHSTVSPFFEPANLTVLDSEHGPVIRVTGNSHINFEAEFRETCCPKTLEDSTWSTQQGDIAWVYSAGLASIAISFSGTSCVEEACEGGAGTTCWVDGRVEGEVGTGWNQVRATMQSGCDILR